MKPKHIEKLFTETKTEMDKLSDNAVKYLETRAADLKSQDLNCADPVELIDIRRERHEVEDYLDAFEELEANIDLLDEKIDEFSDIADDMQAGIKQACALLDELHASGILAGHDLEEKMLDINQDLAVHI